MKKPQVIVVIGPTASGKTSLSIELAKKLNGEIVSADSMQVYEKMQIATAKPTQEEMQGIKHHMISIAKLDEDFSVAKYKDMALECIDDIFSRGKTPIVVGGTGLYVDTLIKNTEFFEQKENLEREKLEKIRDEKGIDYLFEQLKLVDEKTAQRLHLSDEKRIIRALEVYNLTGKTISEQEERSHENESEYDFVVIGLTASDRQFLYNRINQRVDIMIDTGLEEEAREFFNQKNIGTLKQAIGYKELKPYFDGELSLIQACENLKMQTRRYAKRQLTWFRRNQDIHWLNIDEVSDLTAESLKILNECR